MKVELLAPSGDLQRLKTAIQFGADAVYIGGKSFSLRSRASNFDLADIKEAVDYAKQYGAKVMVTANIIPHQEDFEGLEEYLKYLNDIGVFAVICASYAIVKVALKVRTTMEVHLSTQNSSTSSKVIEFWKKKGVDRVVLARELTITDVEETMKNTSLDVEVFIHGGMCSSYSGRCTLSNSMTARDANRGGCAQSCRWKYQLFDRDQLISDDIDPFSMSSKDLMSLKHLPRLIDAGVTSLKVEGRMKSMYYIAVVIGTYRKFIDEYYQKGQIDQTRFKYYLDELSRAENRLSSDGFYTKSPLEKGHLYGINGSGVLQDYLAIVVDRKDDYYQIQVRNKFSTSEILEVYAPRVENKVLDRFVLKNADGEEITMANKPMEILHLYTDLNLNNGDIIRKKIKTKRKGIY